VEFEYCEKCGKRVPESQIKSGVGGHVGVDYFCGDCLPPAAKNRVTRQSTTTRPSAAQERLGSSRRDSRRPEPAPARGEGGRRSRDDYEDEYEDDRGSRRQARSGRSNDRSSGYDRDPRGSANKQKQKKMIMFGGAAAAVVLIVILAVAFGGSKPQPTPTATPSPSATAISAYSDTLAAANRIFDEAMEIYKTGKAKSDPRAQASGIQKALDKLDEAINLMLTVQESYDNANRPVPKDIEKFLEGAYEQRQLWGKSKPHVD
jgi:hypothetical protein